MDDCFGAAGFMRRVNVKVKMEGFSERPLRKADYAGVAEWQTRSTQNRVGNRGGSSPFTGTREIIERSRSLLGDWLLLFLVVQ